MLGGKAGGEDRFFAMVMMTAESAAGAISSRVTNGEDRCASIGVAVGTGVTGCMLLASVGS